MSQEAGKLVGSYQEINTGVQQVDANEENNNESNEFPRRQVDHCLIETESIPERPAFFIQVECTVTINKPASVDVTSIAEAPVVIEL